MKPRATLAGIGRGGLFVGFEMVRATFIPLVGTSAFVGYTQATQAWVIQPVSIFSVYAWTWSFSWLTIAWHWES